MLRFLTQKLRTQSLNEVDQPFQLQQQQQQSQQQQQQLLQQQKQEKRNLHKHKQKLHPHRKNEEEEDDDDCDCDDDDDDATQEQKDKKSDDERDSGTESDDENTEFEDLQHTGNEGSTNKLDNDHGCGELRRSARLVATTFAATSLADNRRSCVHTSSRRHQMDTSASFGESDNDGGSDDDDNDDEDDVDDEDDDGEYRRSVNGRFGSLSLKKKMGPSPVLVPLLDADSALPSDSDHFDHHSSEEELEVINSMIITRSSSAESLPTAAAAATAAAVELVTGNLSRRRRRQCTSSPSTTTALASFGEIRRQLRTRSKSSNRLSSSGGSGVGRSTKPQYNTTTKCPTYQPEKRKWSQANGRRNACDDASVEGSSSDDEVRDLMRSPATPVEFRTSPPAELLVRPTRSSSAAAAAAAAAKVSVSSSSENGGGGGGIMNHHCCTTRSPPTKLFHFSSSNFTPFEVCSVSPRKRHRQMIVAANKAAPSTTSGLAGIGSCHGGGGGGGTSTSASQGQLQRPCLDFEKMQQMRNRSTTGWRKTNRELSLLC